MDTNRCMLIDQYFSGASVTPYSSIKVVKCLCSTVAKNVKKKSRVTAVGVNLLKNIYRYNPHFYARYCVVRIPIQLDSYAVPCSGPRGCVNFRVDFFCVFTELCVFVVESNNRDNRDNHLAYAVKNPVKI